MTKINIYQEVEDRIVAAIKRGQRTYLHTNAFIWDAMREASGRDDNPYVWNAIKTRLQKLRDKGILEHDRAVGWTLVDPQTTPVVLTDLAIKACVDAYIRAATSFSGVNRGTRGIDDGIAAFRAEMKNHQATKAKSEMRARPKSATHRSEHAS